MVIIKINPLLRAKDIIIAEESIRRQAETGVIILPEYCELLNEVPADEEITVITNDGRTFTKRHEARARCKYCAGTSYTDTPFKVLTQSEKVIDVVFNFCPVCGAKLKEEAQADGI